MIYTKGDINLLNILNLLMKKKLRDGVSKEHIVKNDKNKKVIYWVVLLSNKEKNNYKLCF